MEQFGLAPSVLKKIQDKNGLEKELKSGKHLQEILEFSPETMAAMYRSAHHLFEEHHCKEASKAFLFLTTLDPSNFDYWLGLGMSIQLCGDYEGGIDAYEIAAFIDVENPISYFYLSKCFFAMHDRGNAKQALEMAIENAGDDPQYSALKHQAQAALVLIEQEL